MTIHPIRGLVAGLLALMVTIATGSADDRIGVRAGPWTFVLPAGYEPRIDLDTPAYRKEIDGLFHTAVMEVVTVREMRWDDDTLPADPARPGVAVREALKEAAEAQMRDLRRRSQEPDGRIAGITVEPADAAVLPGQNICAGNRWTIIDTGVEPHVGTAFTLRGYDILCFDYSVAERTVGMIGLRFSERYCDALGHRPIRDFEAHAAEIFGTLRYRVEPQQMVGPGTRMLVDPGALAALFSGMGLSGNACPAS